MIGLQGLPVSPFSVSPGEVDGLLGALNRNRRTFDWKTRGLDAEGMRRSVGTSTLTLGGLVKHLAFIEDHYLTHHLLGMDYPDAWHPMADDPDWAWKSAADDTPEELRALWLAAVARSEAAVEQALASGEGFDRMLVSSDWPSLPNLRRVVIDLIEEYARHTGHADLIRESVDGLVGEDAPA
jgi:hypothetical protein